MRVAEARGVVIYEATQAGLKVFEATPLQIKIATTGYGRADKSQVMKMVKILVDIDKTKKSDDELDAIAIALTAFAGRQDHQSALSSGFQVHIAKPIEPVELARAIARLLGRDESGIK